MQIMSLFRKPKKIQRRIFTAVDDDDGGGAAGGSRVGLASAPSSSGREKSHEREVNDEEVVSSETLKLAKDKNAPKALLSFADDEEDVEVFQVRKSSHSKKMMRMLDKERRKRERGGSKSSHGQYESNENNHDPTNGEQRTTATRTFVNDDVVIKMGHGDVVRPKTDMSDAHKSVLKSNSSIKKEIHTDDLVLVVNVEPVVLNGRAAVCAGNSRDISDEEECEDTSYDGMHRFSKPEHIKEMLESGSIPDAAMIHAARKRRQKAREQGEFIPITSKEEVQQRGASLKCEDGEEDNSDDERIDMNDITGQKERDERLQQFYAVENEHSEDDSDQEIQNWESQQLRKGVTGAQLMNAQQDSMLARLMVKPTLQTQDARKDASTSTLLQEAYAKRQTFDRTQKLPNTKLKPSKTVALHTPQEIQEALKLRLRKLTDLNGQHASEISTLKSNIHQLEQESSLCKSRAPDVAKRYRFYQDIKYYMSDLVDCLSEKLPLIVDLEQRTMQNYAKHKNFFVERRRQDVRDQTKEIVGISKAAKADARNDNEEQIKRAAEREGRRTRRRYEREKKEIGMTHLDGTSTDDETPDAFEEQYQVNLEKIEKEAAAVSNDIVDDFCKINLILNKFCLWRQTDPKTYQESFVSLFLPKILGPLVRLNMITWSPLQDNYKEIEKMDWYTMCMLYARRHDETIDELRGDADAQLVPSIVEKIILPKVQDIITQCWDPLSSRQTLRLIGFLNRIARDYPLQESSQIVQNIFKLVLEQMMVALENDVYIPIFPKQFQEAKTSFFQRQFCCCLKLFRNFLSWQGILADKPLMELTITSLLNRYMLLAMRMCSIHDAISKAHHVVNTVPSVWLQTDSVALDNLKPFIDFIRQLLDNCDADNPLQKQSYEDAKQILQKLHTY